MHGVPFRGSPASNDGDNEASPFRNLVYSTPAMAAFGRKNMGSPLRIVVDGLRDLKAGPPLMSPNACRAAMQDTGWADGLRGIAALFVVSSHIVLCFARRVVNPCCGDDDHTPMLFQRPLLRLIAQGHAWLGIFFILSGFVNALKPLKLVRQRQIDVACSGLGTAAFRRSFRLILPATAATFINWFACQLGLLERARFSHAFWLWSYTPIRSSSWGTGLEDLVTALRATWILDATNPYDQPQWALLSLLQGSMMTFVALLITINMKPAWRVGTLVFLAYWSFDWSYRLFDPLIGFTFFLGIVLAEFTYSSLVHEMAAISPYVSPPLVLVGLYLMSFPSSFPRHAPWSAFLDRLGPKVFPPVHEMCRTWTSVGGILLLIAIIISPHLRHGLSRPTLRWLGQVSFPVYLLHGLFMRSVMAWLVFGGATPKPIPIDAQGTTMTVTLYPQPGPLRIILSVAITVAALLWASQWWNDRVEPIFARITKAAEDLMWVRGSDSASPRPPTATGLGVEEKSLLPMRRD